MINIGIDLNEIMSYKRGINVLYTLGYQCVEGIHIVKLAIVIILKKYLFIWLCRLLIAARGIFSCGMWAL